jgi:hypothetical protein
METGFNLVGGKEGVTTLFIRDVFYIKRDIWLRGADSNLKSQENALLVKKFLALYGNWRLNMISHYWSYVESYESNPHPQNSVSFRYILIFSSPTSKSLEWSVPFRIRKQNFISIFHLFMPAICLTNHLPWADYPKCLVKCTNYDARYYAIFSIVSSLNLS